MRPSPHSLNDLALPRTTYSPAAGNTTDHDEMMPCQDLGGWRCRASIKHWMASTSMTLPSTCSVSLPLASDVLGVPPSYCAGGQCWNQTVANYCAGTCSWADPGPVWVCTREVSSVKRVRA
eukprot:1681103-Prymnesium_polylepis.1